MTSRSTRTASVPGWGFGQPTSTAAAKTAMNNDFGRGHGAGWEAMDTNANLLKRDG
jgi:hypothetical protein